MTRTDLRICRLLLAAVVLAASAIGGRAAAAEAPAAAHATAKVGKPVAPRNLLGRRPTPPAATQRIQPNAIGVLVDRPRQQGEAHGTAPVFHSPAPVIGGTSGARLGAQGSGLQGSNHPQFHTPTVTTVVPNRSAINGTGATHPGSAPSGIGGPARGVAGISGSAMRAKH